MLDAVQRLEEIDVVRDEAGDELGDPREHLGAAAHGRNRREPRVMTRPGEQSVVPSWADDHCANRHDYMRVCRKGRGSAEQRFHELAGLEERQVLRALAGADEAHRHAELVADG